MSQWSDLVSIRFDISLQNFKRPSDFFSRQIEKKTFRRIFSYKFGCRKKTLSDFLASRSSSLKTVNTAPGRDTLILVFVNENCRLCKCFTELYFFYWLLVVSLAILIACPWCLFSSFMNIAGVLRNVARIKRFIRLHIVITGTIK